MPKSVEKSSKYVNILKTKPLPLDGDYFKWACDEPDQNIAPWQHATPIVLNYSLITNDTPKEDMDISVFKKVEIMVHLDIYYGMKIIFTLQCYQ